MKGNNRTSIEILDSLLNICVKSNPKEDDILLKLLEKFDTNTIDIINSSTLRKSVLFKEAKRNKLNIEDYLIITLISIGYIESLKDIRVLKFFLSAFDIKTFDLEHFKILLNKYHLPPRKVARFFYLTYEKQINEHNKR